MSAQIEAIKQELSKARDHLNHILDQVGDRWETQVYEDGAAWNIRQLLSHLSVSTRGQLNQAIGIAEEREVIPEDFDLERFNRRSVEKRADLSIEELRQNLNDSLQEIFTWLDNIDDTALEKKGRHASLEIWSVGQILYWMGQHEINHANDIAWKLGIS